MKKYSLVFICLMFGLTAYSASKQYLNTNIPVGGETLAPVNMQAMVLGAVYSNAGKQVSSCRKFALNDTKVFDKPTDLTTDRHGKYISGSWSEQWIINACGTTVYVPINFSYSKQGLKFKIVE